jgi:hypothetical protein
MRIERGRTHYASPLHDDKAHGVCHREVLIGITSKPLGYGRVFEIRAGTHNHGRRLHGSADERQRDTPSGAVHQQRMCLGYDEVGGDEPIACSQASWNTEIPEEALRGMQRLAQQ